MKNAVFDLAANFFPYTFLLATPFCPEFQPLKVGAPIYKGRLPLQMSTILPTNRQTKRCLNYSANNRILYFFWNNFSPGVTKNPGSRPQSLARPQRTHVKAKRCKEAKYNS